MQKTERTDFIREEEIWSLLSAGAAADRKRVSEILAKARECKGLNHEEVAVLLQAEGKDIQEALFAAARHVKNKVYGKRVVLFAPLYTSNECTNNCLYCGFRRDNKELHRKTLTLDEIAEEARAIESQGHKRILLICGEDPRKTNVHHLTAAMKAVYASGDIRRVNVEAAPMAVEDYRLLKEAGIGTYVIFQETYHRETYVRMHPPGTKADFDWRITAIDRAFEAGIDDVGIGALIGLFDWKFEVLALLQHIEHFEKKYGVGPHTISVPRMREAFGWALDKVPCEVSDDDFRKIVAIYRLAVPYTGIILSTRESAQMRDELLSIGISQVSAGSKTNPGGYHEADEHADQFTQGDHRSLPQMISSIVDNGYIPSFCTACYRRCRTGEAFMDHAKNADIHEFCQPNALLTFKENLLDYGTPELREKGNAMIEKALEEIGNAKMKQQTKERLAEIEQGKRDLYF